MPSLVVGHDKGTYVSVHKARGSRARAVHVHDHGDKIEKGFGPVLDAADRFVPRIEVSFTRAARAVQDSVSVRTIEDYLEAQNSEGLLSYLDIENRWINALTGVGLPQGVASFARNLQDVVVAGAEAERVALSNWEVGKAFVDPYKRRGRNVPPRTPTVGGSISFDLLNPNAVSFLRAYTFGLIREISNETAAAIREILVRAFAEGGHPYDQAREIRNLIGLTRRQSAAVANFRRLLLGDVSAMREALTRALRDRRFDPTILRGIRTGRRLTRQQVDNMVQRYYRRFLNYRARMIARTETLRASHVGQRMLWEQAAARGLLPADRTRKVWILATNPCPICAAIPGLNTEGVGLSDTFVLPENVTLEHPPVHPHCRCTVGLRFIRPEVP